MEWGGQKKRCLGIPGRHGMPLERKEGVYKPEAYQTFEIIMKAKQGHVKAHTLRVGQHIRFSRKGEHASPERKNACSEHSRTSYVYLARCNQTSGLQFSS